MTRHKVVITGLGTINALGVNVDSFWENALQGKSVVEPIPRAWRQYSRFNSNYWAPLPAVDYKELGLSNLEIRQYDPTTMMSAVAAMEALSWAGLDTDLLDPRMNRFKIKDINEYKAGCIIGTGVGGISTMLHQNARQVAFAAKQKLTAFTEKVPKQDEENYRGILDMLRFPGFENPFCVSMTMPNAVAANLGIKFSLKGVNRTLAAACASGTVAIGHAFRAIASGEADIILTGGTEFLSNDYGSVFRAFDGARTLVEGNLPASEINRPFDKNRCGFLFGEGGAGIIVLESEKHALDRGAPIVAEIGGYAETFDAYSIMAPAPDGLEVRNLIVNLLENAGIKPDEVDYINAHGTGTAKNDQVEAGVFKELFGKKPVVNSTKSLLGHTIGASGAIETIVTALTIRDGKAHVSRNLDEPLEDLNFAVDTRPVEAAGCLNLSYAFGGHNAGLVIGRYPGQ